MIMNLPNKKINREYLSKKGVKGFILKNDQLDLNWKKPKQMQVVGSYILECISKNNLNVDVMLEIPKVIFISLHK